MNNNWKPCSFTEPPNAQNLLLNALTHLTGAADPQRLLRRKPCMPKKLPGDSPHPACDAPPKERVSSEQCSCRHRPQNKQPSETTHATLESIIRQPCAALAFGRSCRGLRSGGSEATRSLSSCTQVAGAGPAHGQHSLLGVPGRLGPAVATPMHKTRACRPRSMRQLGTGGRGGAWG